MHFLPAAITALGLALPLPAVADSTEARFALRLLGVGVGDLVMAGEEAGGRYAAQARFATRGLAGAVARVHFDMQAEGLAAGNDLTPERYRGEIDTGRDLRAVTMRMTPAQRYIDPMSALWQALRDRDTALGCAMDVTIFDGKKEQRVFLDEVGRMSGALTCAGRMDRLAGYTEAEMAEVAGFPITVTYAEVGGLLRAERIEVDSLHGRVVLVRR